MKRVSCPALFLSLAIVAAVGFVGGCGGPKQMAPVVTSPRPQPRETGAPEAPATSTPLPPVPWLAPSGPLLILGVGLLENKDTLVVEAEGPAWVREANSGRTLAALDAGRPLRCSREGDRVTWNAGGESGSDLAIVLQPIDPGHLVKSGDSRFRGELLVIVAPRGGGLTLVNNIELEDYLKGVVPWEIGRHGADKFAALCAQAVAARTYTVAHLGARRARGFDVFASVMDQVYKGAADEDTLCNRAIAATAPLVLQHDGLEIEAYYSACCGGISSRVDEVWPKAPVAYLQSRRDGPARDGKAFCAGSRHTQWQETWTAAGLEGILKRTLPEYVDYMAKDGRSKWAGTVFEPGRGGDPRRPGALVNLEVRSRASCGRIADLAITTQAGTYHVRGDRVRWVLTPASGNPTILRSAKFDVDVARKGKLPTGITVRGSGFGHGVGLCQTGALAMAAEGHSFEEILAHYYPGATLAEPSGKKR